MSRQAAAGLVFLFGDREAPMQLRVISETQTTITLGWDPVPGAVGYRFSREGYVKPDGSPRYSSTFNPQATQVKFAKAAWYKVEALGVLDADTYP